MLHENVAAPRARAHATQHKTQSNAKHTNKFYNTSKPHEQQFYSPQRTTKQTWHKNIIHRTASENQVFLQIVKKILKTFIFWLLLLRRDRIDM